MKLKTAPRVILGLLLVGGVIYGINFWIDKRPSPKPVAAVEQPPAVSAAPQEITQPAPQPAPQAQVAQQPAPQAQVAQQPAPDRRHDAGLNALITGGTK